MIRPRRVPAALAALPLAVLGLTGCERPDCSLLGQPDPRLVAASEVVVAGEAVEVEAELENEVGTAECVVIDGRWVDTTDVDEA